MLKIELLQPPRSNLQSGGYLFNENITKLLKEKGICKLVEVKKENLIEYISEASFKRVVIVLDSIYLQFIDFSEIKPLLREENLKIILLLHLLPSSDLDKESFDNQILKKLNSRELAWIKQSNLVIIVTGSSYKKELLKHRVCSSRVKVVNPGQESYPFKTTKVGESKKIHYPIKGISVGSISPRKNQILLVDMLSKINPKLYRWTFIGNKQLFPEYTKKVMNMANKGNWKASLFFVGQVHHSKVLMSLTDSDLFVSTSVKESYGMSVAEACSVGLPVLSFNTGDFSSWVKHNQNGYLIDQDDIRGMQNKLNDVISDLSILTGLKDVAKKNSSGIHFPTWEESSTKLEKICRTIY